MKFMKMIFGFLILSVIVGHLVAYAGQEEYRHEAFDQIMSFDSHYGNLYDMKIDLKKGAGIDSMDEQGVTPLMVAARRGAIGYLKALLARLPDANIRSKFDGETALIKAARYGHAQIVKELLKAGANVEIKDNSGWNALMHAAYYSGDESFSRHSRHALVVKELLFYGTDVNEKNLEGRSALDLLSIHSYRPDQKDESVITTIGEMLIAEGADPSMKGPFKRNALMNAAAHGHLGLVKLFIFWGLDPLEKDKEGKTSIDLAARYKNKSIFQYLNSSIQPVSTSFGEDLR